MAYYLSYLMGAAQISDDELKAVGAEIVGRSASGSRRLHIPTGKLGEYEKLVAAKLDPGFWNDIVGEEEILFIFKFKDGEVKRLMFSEENRTHIARLCSEFNGDPIELTSDTLNYLSGNDFYAERISKHFSDKKDER